MKVIAGNLTQGAAVVAAQKGLSNLSKGLKENTSYRLFFPMDETGSVVITGTVGRQLDGNNLNKKYFVVIDDATETESHKFIDNNSGLDVYARLARVLFKAEYKAAIAAVEAEADRTAEQTGSPRDEVALTAAINDIKLEYEGDAKKEVYAKKNPVISGLKTPLTSEVYCVPLDKNGVPDFEAGFAATLDIKEKQRTQLQNILAKSEYVTPGAKFLEVGYDYTGKTKQEAGKNASYQGISADLTLSAKYPDIWEANKSKLDSNVTHDPETMLGRNMTFSNACSVAEAKALLAAYFSKQKAVLPYIDFEAEETKKAAPDLLELAAVKAAPRIQEKLIAIVEAQKAEKTQEVEEEAAVQAGDAVSSEAVQAAQSKSLAELAASGVSASELDSGSVTNLDDI